MITKPLPVEGCGPSCPYFHESFVPPESIGEGPPYDLVIVGEAPGYEETVQGRPFVGRSGQIVRRILDELSVEKVYITNVVKCRPPGNETPVKDALSRCREYLLEEIRNASPKVVLALGSVATKALIGKGSVSSVLNTAVKFSECGDGDCVVIPTYHPAAALRRTHLLQHIVQAFNIAEKIIRGADFGENLVKKVVVVRSDSDLSPSLLEDLEKEGYFDGSSLIAFDIETNTLDPYSPEAVVWMVSVSNGESAYVFVTHPVFGSVNGVRDVVRLILKSPSKKVAHNALFDVPFLEQWLGVRVENLVSDTMVLHYLRDENLPHSLSNILNELGIFNHKMSFLDQAEIKKVSQAFSSEEKLLENFDLVVEYSAMDSAVLPVVHKRLYTVLPQKQKHLLEFLLVPAIYALGDLQKNGMLVDMETFVRVGEYLLNSMKELQDKMMNTPEVVEYLKHNPVSTVNFNSTLVLRKIFFEYAGLPVLSQTDKGQPSLKADIVEEYCSKYKNPFACMLLEFRKARQLYSTFIKGIKRHIHPITHRVHPHYHLTNTVTGRLSCSDPNIQQIPRDSIVRSMFVAPDGYWFVEADYNQMELRVAAALSGDRTMIEVYKRGEDLHTRTARAVFRKEEISSEERAVAKAINFGMLYGMGPNKLMYTLSRLGWEITESQAREFIESFFKEYPSLRDWIRSIEEKVKRGELIETPVGRIRHLLGSTPRDIRQAINFPVQSTASDITLISVIRINDVFKRKGMKSKVVGTVHDSILFEVHDSELEQAVAIIKEIMENPPSPEYDFLGDVPIVAEIAIGKAWGQKIVEF